jgi:peptidyl-tRNA hydrolase
VLNSDKFKRIRIGIGRPKDSGFKNETVSDFVLEEFSDLEKKTLNAEVFPQFKEILLRYLLSEKSTPRVINNSDT